MGAHILVIEDNAANLQLMTYLLEAFGHRTDAARNGDEGVEKAAHGGYDVIVSDIQLPGRDGYAVARAIREQAGSVRVSLVAVTAFAQVGDREKVLSAGFDGYISKPIVPETFVREIESFLPPALRSTPVPSVATPVSVAAARAPVAKGAEILVVDDVEANVELLRSLLEPFGHRVSTVRGVLEAERLLAGLVPDLVISDLHLEDGTGYDLMDVMKRDPRLGRVPFVFVSSTVRGSQERARGLALGARKFIVRPIDPSILLAEIEDCLRSA
jgi:two-component system, cell cycle response regulator